MLPFPSGNDDSLLPIICISFGIFVFFTILPTFCFADFLVTLFIVFFSYSCQYFLNVLHSKVYNPFCYIKNRFPSQRLIVLPRLKCLVCHFFLSTFEFFFLQKTVDPLKQRGQVFSFTDTVLKRTSRSRRPVYLL